MKSSGIERYIPWADDALLPGESTYALLNKLAWFAGRGPVSLMRDLRVTDTQEYPVAPRQIKYGTVVHEWYSKTAESMWPLLGSRLGKYFESARFDVLDAFADSVCESAQLRFCPDCIAAGMHFTLAQLRLVEYCPYHHKRLVSACPVCGEVVSYEAGSLTDAFSCGECGSSLLEEGLTDIRANQRYRWHVSHAHQRLAGSLESAPMIYGVESGRLGGTELFPGLKHAMSGLLFESLPSQGSMCYPRSAVVKVARNARGQPCIRRIPELQPIREERRTEPPTDRHVHQVAQLRVGAWALQTYAEHAACICAARELVRSKKFVRFPTVENYPICCMGAGFAIWEARCADRVQNRLAEDLWERWGLGAITEKAFASYVLEKACLISIVVPFLTNQLAALADWGGSAYALSGWSTPFYEGQDRAILWRDCREMEFSEACDISRLSHTARMAWLALACVEARGGKPYDGDAGAYPYFALRDLHQAYAAHQRYAAAGAPSTRR